MIFFFFVEVETEILDSNIDEAQLQRLRNGERPGALWHLFRSDDVKQIREYLNRVCTYHFNFNQSTFFFSIRHNGKLPVRILYMIKQHISKKKI